MQNKLVFKFTFKILLLEFGDKTLDMKMKKKCFFLQQKQIRNSTI